MTLKSLFDLFDCFFGDTLLGDFVETLVNSVSSLLKEIFKSGSAVNSIRKCFDPMARKSNQKLRAKKSSNRKGPAIPPGKYEPSAARKTRTV